MTEKEIREFWNDGGRGRGAWIATITADIEAVPVPIAGKRLTTMRTSISVGRCELRFDNWGIRILDSGLGFAEMETTSRQKVRDRPRSLFQFLHLWPDESFPKSEYSIHESLGSGSSRD